MAKKTKAVEVTEVVAKAVVEAVSKSKGKNKPVENALKATGKPAPAPAPVVEKAKPAPAPKADAPKPAPKPVDKPVSAPKVVPFAKAFPDMLKSKELGVLRRAKNMDTYEQLVIALENEKDLVIAAYWPADYIKEYQYASNYLVKAPKSFENDLDLMRVVIPCETVDRFYVMSLYTEALLRFEGEDLKYHKTKDANGTVFQTRQTAGLEFEIYEVTGEAVEPEPEAEKVEEKKAEPAKAQKPAPAPKPAPQAQKPAPAPAKQAPQAQKPAPKPAPAPAPKKAESSAKPANPKAKKIEA